MNKNFAVAFRPFTTADIPKLMGRMDRIGSLNESIQLVNYWPDISLDKYINLKEHEFDKLESRMKKKNSLIAKSNSIDPLMS